jgi:hypothetical protein
VADGCQALYSSMQDFYSVAVGSQALYSSTAGEENTAVGWHALYNSQAGTNNVAIGYKSGDVLVNGVDDIDIGDFGSEANSGESSTIRIGHPNLQLAVFIAGIDGETTSDLNSATEVFIDENGNLGTVKSSRRYKEDINDMGDVSARLLRLRPVRFRYKKPSINGDKPIQFGLIAEEVAQVFPEMAIYNQQGQPETVKYQMLAPLLLNEFIKEHSRVEEQAKAIAAQGKIICDYERRFAEQEQRFAAQEKINAQLVAGLKQQASLIQTVSARLEASKPATQTVANLQ